MDNTNNIEELLKYQDEKADSRMDALLNSIDTIKFWVRIIGIYILIKTIAIVAITVTKGYLLIELLNGLQQLFNGTF